MICIMGPLNLAYFYFIDKFFLYRYRFIDEDGKYMVK